MNLIRETIGLILIFLAWVDPFNFSFPIRIALFILGFDMISWILKLLIFGIDYFIGFGIGWVLLILLAVELITTFLLMRFVFDLILKPAAVFLALYLSNVSFEIALIAAGIDVILNLTKKWI